MPMSPAQLCLLCALGCVLNLIPVEPWDSCGSGIALGCFLFVLNCLIRDFRNYSFGHSSSERLLFQVFDALIQ